MAIYVVPSKEFKEFSTREVRATLALDVGKARVLLLNLEAGQMVAPCEMAVTVMYYVIEGRGAIQVGGEDTGLETGSLTFVPGGELTRISAVQRMRMLAVQIP